MSALNKTWFDEYLEEDPSREVRFIGRDGYSEHAQYISKRKSFTGELLYTVKEMRTGEILKITSEQITDILRPKNWLEYWNNKGVYMKIISPQDNTGWITAIIEGRWVQAKVYDEPSKFGINNGRVSKLAVSKTSTRDENKDFFEQMCYNYDRGLDFNEAPKDLIKKIVAELETLPKKF